MRNSPDFLVLNKLAKAVLAVPGIARVQAVTRPEGTPIQHSTIPFMMSMGSASQLQIMPFQRARMDDLVTQADELTKTINTMQRMYDLMQKVASTTNDMAGHTHELEDVTNELRDDVADFDDFYRPIRNYFYWEPHCFDIPICWSIDLSLIHSTESIKSAIRCVFSSPTSIG